MKATHAASPARSPGRWPGWVLLSLLAACWGTSFLWIKIALTGFSPVQIAVLRLALGSAVLLSYCRLRGIALPGDWRTWRIITPLAVGGIALPFVLIGLAEQHISSGLAGTLMSTTPLWTLALTGIAGKERVRPVQIAGAIIGCCGVGFLAAPADAGNRTVLGVCSILLVTLLYAGKYLATARYLTGLGLDPVAVATSHLLIATVGLAISTPVLGAQTDEATPTALLALLVLGVVGTGIAFVLQYRLISQAGATTTSLNGFLTPIVATALGALVLDEPLSTARLGGVLLILVGLALVQLSPGYHRFRR